MRTHGAGCPRRPGAAACLLSARTGRSGGERLGTGGCLRIYRSFLYGRQHTDHQRPLPPGVTARPRPQSFRKLVIDPVRAQRGRRHPVAGRADGGPRPDARPADGPADMARGGRDLAVPRWRQAPGGRGPGAAGRSDLTHIANFQIQHCAVANCASGTPVAGGTSGSSTTEHTVTGLTADTTCHFRIQARASTNSKHDHSVFARTVSHTAATPLAKVAGLNASTRDHESVTLGGTAPGSATGRARYQIHTCTSANCSGTPTRATPTASATSPKVSGLNRNRTCYFRLRAAVQANHVDSAWSDIPVLTSDKGSLPAIPGWTVKGNTIALDARRHTALCACIVPPCVNNSTTNCPGTYDTAQTTVDWPCTKSWQLQGPGPGARQCGLPGRAPGLRSCPNDLRHVA